MSPRPAPKMAWASNPMPRSMSPVQNFAPYRRGESTGSPIRNNRKAVLCAHAYLAVTAAQAKKGGAESDDGLIPLTLGEVRRLLAHLITTIRPFDHIDRWSRWRRRHQYRAKTTHYQRRLRLHQVRLEY